MGAGRPRDDDRCRRRFRATSYTAPSAHDAKIRAFMADVRAHIDAQGPAGRRALARRVHRQEDAHARVSAGRRAARRAHSRARRAFRGRARRTPTAPSRPADELRAIYEQEQGLTPSDDVIAYCRIGERSSHTWFVLTLPARLRQGAQLRRQLDRVGQRRPRSDRDAEERR